jgi:TPR repeat protein
MRDVSIRLNRYAWLAALFSLPCACGTRVPSADSSPTPTPANVATSVASTESSARSQAPAPKHCLDPDEQGCTQRCAAGDEVSCLRLAGMYNKVGKTAAGDHRDKSRAITQASCTRGYGPACAYFASLLDHGWGGPKDPEGAQAAQKKAVSLDGPLCDQGDPEACNDLEYAYSMGDGAPESKEKSKSFEKRTIELYLVECNRGDPAKCTSYGLLGGHPEFVERGCAEGDAFACLDLGYDCKNGNDRPKDPEKARAFFDKSCKANVLEACDQLKK